MDCVSLTPKYTSDGLDFQDACGWDHMSLFNNEELRSSVVTHLDTNTQTLEAKPLCEEISDINQ